MKIAEIKVKLTEEDVFEAICEYVKVENFQIEEISFKDIITIGCSFKKGIKILFKVKVEIYNIEHNVINFRIVDINIAKIHLIKGIKNYVLKKLIKDFEEQGISIDKETISVNLNTILKRVPNIEFKLVEIHAANGDLQVTVEELAYIKDKVAVQEKVKVEEIKTINKEAEIQDNYSILRKKISKRVPEKYAIAAEYAFMIPDIIILMGRLLKDQRVGVKAKVVIGSIVAYYASPIDFAILFIPFIGEVSALALAFYGLNYVVQEIPEDIILENWQGKEVNIQKLKDIVGIINSAAGGRNITRLLGLSGKTHKKS